jgi:hypothetical protein
MIVNPLSHAVSATRILLCDDGMAGAPPLSTSVLAITLFGGIMLTLGTVAVSRRRTSSA